MLSHVLLSATPWTVAYQAPPSMEFSRLEYWSGLLFPFPGDRTQVSYIAGRRFTFWATREDYIENNLLLMKKIKHISNVLRVPKYVYSIKILHKV